MTGEVSREERELRAHVDAGQPLFIIHYACGDFMTELSPPITCVMLVDYYRGDVETHARGDATETQMLEKVFGFFTANPNAKFVHWNMKNPEYGFRHLAERLGPDSVKAAPAKGRVYCLNSMLKARFGRDYVRHPRLASLALYNGLVGPQPWLPGRSEAQLEPVDVAHPIIRESSEEKARVIRKLTELFLTDNLAVPGPSDRKFLPPTAAPQNWWRRLVASWAALPAGYKWTIMCTLGLAALSGVWSYYVYLKPPIQSTTRSTEFDEQPKTVKGISE